MRRALVVAAVSAGTIAYEILLVRVFAIQYFYHFAYMAIGVAMLGFGASGVLFALRRPNPAHAARYWFPNAAVSTAVTLLLAPALAERISLDPTQLPWEPSQWLRLGALYVVLSAPFLAGGLTTVAALHAEPERRGVLYGSSFIGSGIGSMLALACLWWLAPGNALAVPATLAAIGVVWVASGSSLTWRVLAIVPLLLSGAALAAPPWQPGSNRLLWSISFP